MQLTLTHNNKNFTISIKNFGETTQRVIVNDSGLDFPFTSLDKAVEFIVQEYGGDFNELLTYVVNKFRETTETTEASADTVESESSKKSKKSNYTYKRAKEYDADVEITNEEIVFHLIDGDMIRKVVKRKPSPEMKPIAVEDVQLDDLHGLHIEIYDKFKACTLYKIEKQPKYDTKVLYSGNYPVQVITNYEDIKGDVLIENVAVTDIVFKYAEITGSSYHPADRYIKTKRGLLAPPKRAITATDNKSVTIQDFIKKPKNQNKIDVDLL